ncbi:MAG: glycosyltransferase family 39 protein [Anaerolineales bacterium]|nr:glycosyltransferase family 39 protein [Anaerolineales bacterium]
MFVMRDIMTKLKKAKWLAYLVALAGGVFFVVQLWMYAHTQTSLVDEGMYLFLGYRFVEGGNISYGDLGAWNYYAPLSYLIPGTIQSWFGPGLRTGRYFSILLSVLMAFALWVTARRLRGKWWAAAVIWALALTPMQNKMYSLALSQALVACMLAWSLMLILGEKRTLWQIICASLLAGLLIMTRHNLIPLLPLLVAYVFWQHGRKAGWWSLAACMLPFLIGHIVYWPNILRLWSFYWLPAQWIPSLSQYGPPSGTTQALNGDLTITTQLIAFFTGFRVHYIVLVGALAVLLLWPRRRQWENQVNMRASIFLAALFFSLLVLHGWATLGYSQCTFCFAPYTAFFSNTALLLVVVSISSWDKKPSFPRQIIIVLVLLLVSLGLGFATFEDFGDWLLKLNVPRISSGVHFGEWVSLWDYVGNGLRLEYTTARELFPPILGLLGGILLLGLIFTVQRSLKRRGIHIGYAFGALALVVFLAVGYFISPLMNGAFREGGDCSIDVIENYENIGRDLKDLIPPGSQIYWTVGSAVPLLYLPDVNIHPAQIYGTYTYRNGGDAAVVEKSGYWNEELALQWLEEADFAIFEEATLLYSPSLQEAVSARAFTLTIFPPVNPCVKDTRLLVYQRIP